jgi:hypothetical protein
MPWARRLAALVTAWAFAAALVPNAAFARDMYLDSGEEMSETGLTITGWSFTGLTLLSLGYAAYSYQVSQDELDEADKAYDDYQSATTEEDANRLHAKVDSHHDKAKAAETRTNIAIALTIIFATTAFFSFSPESAPNISVTATTRGPRFEWRF